MEAIVLPCPSCKVKTVIVNPEEGKILGCKCGAQLKLVWEKSKNPISIPWLIGTSIFLGAASAALGGYITGAWPRPGEPEEVKREKTEKLVGAGLASSFVGLVYGLLVGR